MSRRVVPFGREIRGPRPAAPLGDRGSDVKAVKRALARAGHGKLGHLTPTFGPFAVIHLKNFQREARIYTDPNYDLASHRALVRFFDDYAVYLYTGALPGETPEERTRRLIVAACLALYSIRDQVHYTQSSRRMQIVREKLRPPFGATDIYEDCSSLVTGVYWLANGPDPNDRDFDGQGYTGTLGRNGKVVSIRDAKPGDVVLYGRGWPWQHTGVLLDGGRVLSHGNESGPLILPVDYRSDRGEIRSYL